jgi:hypothetical protein
MARINPSLVLPDLMSFCKPAFASAVSESNPGTTDDAEILAADSAEDFTASNNSDDNLDTSSKADSSYGGGSSRFLTIELTGLNNSSLSIWYGINSTLDAFFGGNGLSIY